MADLRMMVIAVAGCVVASCGDAVETEQRKIDADAAASVIRIDNALDRADAATGAPVASPATAPATAPAIAAAPATSPNPAPEPDASGAAAAPVSTTSEIGASRGGNIAAAED